MDRIFFDLRDLLILFNHGASEPAIRRGKLVTMRVLLTLLVALLAASSCGGSSDAEPATVIAAPTVVPTVVASATAEQAEIEVGPGGYGFDRTDPVAGVANIMEAFVTDEATATCIYEAWGDVANVPPAELTPELMTFEICGTSILRMMTGSG